ncbi:MAG TPA: glucans biosynthesis glucosyltransferase MdoH [Gammaproteobacteria bacterium]|nr:glucans biosynthesis glucosyltransferase MdoH [Gammaproteobacteria bacterium]
MTAANRFNHWKLIAGLRRVALFVAVGVQTWLATGYLLKILPDHGATWTETAIATLFAILFGWISMGFWTALAGFFVLLLRPRASSISELLEDVDPERIDLPRTAIVAPICNEDPERVFAGLRATWESLIETGQHGHFELFVLSDTSDPDIWVEEEAAWAQWLREAGAPRVHYRHRRTRIKKKTGNIADFCRRWGNDYRYMIVFDADSLMTGETLVKMVRIMERRRQIGILQTAPLTVNRRSIYARAQQFGNHVFGPLFTAGLNFWQMGDGYYWGHNAIIRLRPFIEHCGLQRLPGDHAMGGEILSHDFVEAAYMRRAGYEVWLAWDLPGSYEEPPPALLDELKRDRRWSQGNLQHLRLIGQPGITLTHRVMFLYGIMAYGSSLFWLLLLAASTLNLTQHAGQPVSFFPDHFTLYPDWSPAWAFERAMTLMATTATLLFAPKILGMLTAMFPGRVARGYGGRIRILLGVLLEALLSALLAPVRMLYHSRYVLLTLMGKTAGWKTQQREDKGVSWREALLQHGPGALLAAAWAAWIWRVDTGYLPWISPIVAALILAAPISRWTSLAGPGDFLRRLGLFAIPAETRPDPLLTTLHRYLNREAGDHSPHGFQRAVIDPLINALHIALLPSPGTRPFRTRQNLNLLKYRALRQGPGMPAEDRMTLLNDADTLRWLHREIWQSVHPDISRAWRDDMGKA